MARFYEGLKDAVKDDLIREDRPETLTEYIAMAVKIDDRYGAQGNYMSPEYINKNKITWKYKEEPYQLSTVEGQAVSYGGGIVNTETAPLQVFISRRQGHITFDITNMGGKQIILGIPWLRQWNPTPKATNIAASIRKIQDQIKLDLELFTYNSSPSESTKESPFYANYGYNPTAYAERREAPDTPKATNIAASIRKIQDQIKLDLELRI
ncbi:hypothetical protein BN1708_004964 [Verticillium longisporum]|uniref:Uncharacterized protein n=1 Tax=Verticillium longisporum TaxID=100787 RepID=A0A0G4M5V0_VERLO|nr:hypothetical protein BN1708_004964 [Verticillium longisporum]